MFWDAIRESNFISFLASLAEMFIRSFCFCQLVKPFIASEVTSDSASASKGMERILKKKKKGASYAAAVYFSTMLLIYMIPLYDAYAMFAIGILAAFSALCLVDRRNYRQKFFLVATFFSFNWFAAAMADILYDDLYEFAGNTQFMRSHSHLWLALYAAVRVFYLVVEFALTAVGIWFILKVYANKHAEMETRELIMLSLPSFMGMVGFEIVRYYRTFYILKTEKIKNDYDALALLFYAVAIITVMVVIVLYQQIKRKQEENLQSELLQTQIDSIQRHMAQVEELYQDIRRARHDMTNHVLTLETLYAGNQTAEAKSYGDALKTELAAMTGEIKSGNPVTDVILQERKKEAQKKRISFYQEFHYLADTGVNAFDVSVILHNALQNAIENTAKDGQITVVSYRRKNAYMIEVSNTFTGELHWDAQSGLPLTTKTDKDGHGYGLSNIRRVARKYAGDIDVERKEGEFRLCVMLMMG